MRQVDNWRANFGIVQADSPAYLRKAHLTSALFVSWLTLFSHSVESQEPQKTPPTTPSTESLAQALEDLGLIYKDKDDEVLQELWLLGRYHGQYHWTQGEGDKDASDYETRRFRLGFQAQLFKNLTVHAQMVSGSDISPFYNGFTELWAKWEFDPAVALTIGQQKHRFTHDRNVSSRYLNYLERSMLTNMFRADYTPAITLQGRVNNIAYYTGVFSNATGRNIGEAFTELDSGYSYLAAVYYDLGETLGLDNLTLHSTYLHSEANQNATNLNNFNDGVSAAAILTEQSFSLVTELTSGLGGDLGNAVGLNIQPGYFLTDTLQLVGRYQLALSSESEGLLPQSRYEREVGLLPGDHYQASYLGLNYYIAGHRLKLQGGTEYSRMNNQDVWTFSTMLRFYFGPHSGGAFPMNRVLPGGAWEGD